MFAGVKSREPAGGRSTWNWALSRAIGRTWRELWPRVKKLEERKDVGRAISAAEQGKPLDATLRSPVVRTAIPLLMLTGLRSGEALSLLWRQVNLFERTITVGRAKTSSSTGRVISINDDLAKLFASHRAWFVERFGEPELEHCVFPFGSPQPTDPEKPVTDISSGWDLVVPIGRILPPARPQTHILYAPCQEWRARVHNARPDGPHEPSDAGTV
jgi:integrase